VPRGEFTSWAKVVPVVSEVAGPVQTTVIQPSGGWRALDLRELWRFRELVFFLAQRDVKVRYKQTALGIAWVLLQPLLAMGIFSIVFSQRGLTTGGVPYPLFVVSGLVPWFYFSNATSGASGSIVGNTQLISKVYFPRLAIPLAAVLANLVDLGIGLLLELVLLVGFGVGLSWQLLAIPVLVGLMVLTALGVSVWLSALDVQYRDVRYAVPFLIQVWLFATPVIYSTGDVPERWRPVLALNPMTGVIEAFRWALLGTGDLPLGGLAVSTALVLLLLGTGLLYFRRMERTFADVI
jgi:lipopolysaccharide transport system permease protein